MKKLIFPIALSLMIVSTSYAEDIKVEAIDSLSNAQTFVDKGNYSQAVEEINYALAKINELTAQGLMKFIPAPPPGYTLVNKQSQGTGAGAVIAGNAGANASYSNPDGASINLTIAIGGMAGKLASLAAFGQMFAGLAPSGEGTQSKKIRVQGYTGTEMSSSQEKSTTLTFQIGDKTSVTLEGVNIESTEILRDMAETIDFAGLEKNY